MQVQISKEVIDKIWDENPSKSEVISRCGWRGRKNQMPTKNRHSLDAKFKQKKSSNLDQTMFPASLCSYFGELKQFIAKFQS